MLEKTPDKSTIRTKPALQRNQIDVLLTVKDVAQLDCCSEKTVRRAIEAGSLRVTRIGVGGRLIRISKADHAAYRASF